MLKGLPITFNIYAESEEEIKTLHTVITEFIRVNAEQGRAVTAVKVTEALRGWEKNPFVRNRIISYLNGKQ